MKRICGLAALAVCAVAIAVMASGTGGASNAGVSASVQPTNPGPLHACSTPPADCPLNTATQFIIYTENSNRPVHWFTAAITRSQIPNAYAVTGIDQTVTVNGVPRPEFSGTFTPPPAASPPVFAGRWPVSCAPFSSPCDVTSPAVLPGERTAPLVSRWIHGAEEPDGSYVFTFTIHGTLNGAPLDVVATSKAIRMTR